MKQFNFPNPDEVGSSEYRAIYSCLQSGLEDCPAEERTELAAAMLEEFRAHAAAMLKQLRERTVQVSGVTEPQSASPAVDVQAAAACEIVAAIREYMFRQDGRWQWRELSGADFIEFVTLLLSQHDLVPELAED